jgi:hypothetical protein
MYFRTLQECASAITQPYVYLRSFSDDSRLLSGALVGSGPDD